MRWRTMTVLSLALASCGSAKPQHPNRVIFPPSEAAALLKQCSRNAPVMGERAWQPTDADVDALEGALPGALATLPQAREVAFSALLERWQRQYAGIIRAGRRYIY